MTIDTNTASSRMVIWGSFLAIAGFLVWANWAELDQITRASGQVIASSRNQVIQAPDGGVLAALPVREGAQVKRDELLARFDKTRTEASYLESAAKAAALRASLARLTAEIVGGQPKFPPELDQYPDFRTTQLALFNKRQAAVREEIGALEQSRTLIKEELDMNLPLLKTGDVSRAEILKLQRQGAEIQGQMTNRRNKYLQEIQTDLAKAQEDLAGVLQILAQRKEQLDYTEIRAPMDGIVRNVRLTTLGGVAKPGEEIMQIVPLNDDMIIEAKVKPADIAFIRPGLSANVKLDAYDYTLYGTLRGEVIYISADTLNEEVRGNELPYYRVQIKTSADNLVSRGNRRIDIQPGMTASVEIKTGSNTVLRYLTKPITKTLNESLGER
ncbi:MAG: HlyD family type I secretion periplasmic adaptor subunit [Gammaproteobacteria bacterium]|uniref:HlyD family type I secretion periplasmic adaptor subunit n=1 Tax=Rhodoferax sp. TaxID=50421 RepID=UPI00178EA9A1|nr:HlyD family type I secretion periplasmic adaptor subunit [Rhodoferax sp.]MBU3897698.1 HlyD family type I secretion periplasmic adaptor subunit [Gammaproteobacteria bacterium]MBA3057790.1 HlyD family type I secretion periplasmic adaptor subunit [Rhodoferax sp.]MBU3998807.1 HlyD family type I secretion periplasmic adaptor subunit [Gammaproteobacteria bacterium]MBU4081541.1 HlyD family type I secretion periplasmic adaptor subunit [Gammaproteobacteria bacterium]MBU4114058.1 HlyD family type I s